jgi:NADH-quinone oxidoreductase subunit L
MHHEQDIRKMGGLKSKLPITHFTFLMGCIAIAGIPPFSGFFSKDEILAAAFEKNKIYWVLGLVGAAMTAFYMFRLYATTFLGKFRGSHDQEAHMHESPLAMTLPLIILAILSAVGGAIGIPHSMGGNHWLTGQLSTIVSTPKEASLAVSTEWILMGVSVAIAAIALIIALLKYTSPTDEEPSSAIGKFFYNKWYIDEFYQKAIITPLNEFALFLKEFIEKKIIDGAVNGTGKLVQFSARKVRYIQNGQVGYYILFMVFGIITLFLIWFNDISILQLIHTLFQK